MPLVSVPLIRTGAVMRRSCSGTPCSARSSRSRTRRCCSICSRCTCQRARMSSRGITSRSSSHPIRSSTTRASPRRSSTRRMALHGCTRARCARPRHTREAARPTPPTARRRAGPLEGDGQGGGSDGRRCTGRQRPQACARADAARRLVRFPSRLFVDSRRRPVVGRGHRRGDTAAAAVACTSGCTPRTPRSPSRASDAPRPSTWQLRASVGYAEDGAGADGLLEAEAFSEALKDEVRASPPPPRADARSTPCNPPPSRGSSGPTLSSTTPKICSDRSLWPLATSPPPQSRKH